jgi:hypothetical protein
MPLTEVKEYLAERLELGRLMPDDMMVYQLEQLLETFRM